MNNKKESVDAARVEYVCLRTMGGRGRKNNGRRSDETKRSTHIDPNERARQ